jgi:AraC-like DNA-binding protein
MHAPLLSRRADPVLSGIRQFAAARGVSADGVDLTPLWSGLRSAGLPFPGLAYADWADTLALGGVLATVLANSPTLETALTLLERFHPLLGRDVIALSRNASAVGVSLQAAAGGAADPETVDAAFAMLARVGYRLAGVRPGHAYLRRPMPENPQPHRRALGSVSFGQPSDRLMYSAKDASAPIPEADPALLDTVLPYAHRQISALRPSWASAVRSVLSTADGSPSLADVARSLAVGVRTLQLRLAEEGVTFGAVSDAVRRDKAFALLADPGTTVTAVSARVGFATPAAFVRAFRRWTGLTPSEYRQRRGQPERRKS